MNKILTLICLLLIQPAALSQTDTHSPFQGVADPPAATGAIAHRLTKGQHGLLLSWIEPADDGFRLCWSRYSTQGWNPPSTITTQKHMMANWADVPAVVESLDGSLYAHWLSPSPRSPEWYDIRMLRSADNGTTWSELGTLNDDGIEAEHGFVSYVPLRTGVRAYWLDGRMTRTTTEDNLPGPMQLRTTTISETIAPSTLLDPRVCDCCSTSAAMTESGPIVVYRNRSENEVRDIALASINEESARILHNDGWTIAGCPVNGPAVAVQGRTVAVAWFTLDQGRPTVFAAISTDSGESFHPPIILDQHPGKSAPLGRVDVVLDGETAIVAWLAQDTLGGALKLQRCSPTHRLGNPVTVAPMHPGRLSGFPQLQLLDGHAVLVWRDPGEKRLHATPVPLDWIGRETPSN